MVSTLFILQRTTRNRVQEDIEKRFQGSHVALRHLQDLRKQYAVDAINTLTKTNAQFRSVLSTASVSDTDMGFKEPANAEGFLKDANLRLNSLLPFLSMYREYDLFIVMNAEGSLLFSKPFPGRFGDDLSALPLLAQLEENSEAVDIWYSYMKEESDFLFPSGERDGVYQVVAKPVVFNEEIHGVVICGRSIDNNTLARLKRISGVDLALYSGEGVLATTLPPTRTQALNGFIGSPNFSRKTDINELYLDKESFLSMLFPILPRMRLDEGGFIVLKSLTQEMELASRLRFTLLIVGTIILLIAICISFLLSGGITKPVKQLALAARDIGAGQLDTEVEIRTGDEIENLGNAFNDMVKGLKERDFIKSTFERYVSATVAAEIIRNPDMLHLGGQKKTITILFTDIGDFTNLSEMLSPEDVVSHLNEYFQGMSSAILDYNGTINKFQGDAILAFWGAPVEQEDHALLACQAALRCLEFLTELEKKWVAEGLPPRTYRFGINTGEVVVGNIGSSSRFEYTVIGDDVNLASRLEAANKYYGTQIFISERTYSLIKDRLVAREIDIIRVVGKSEPIKVYELVAEKREIDERKVRLLERFEAGIHAYRGRQWGTAISCFEQVLHLAPEDSPAKVYIKRCQQYEQAAPAQDWEGVFELKAK